MASFIEEVEKSALHQVCRFFVERVSSIPQVQSIAAYSEDGFIHFWTIIPRRDRAVQRKIYAAELELMDHFPTFSYDFNVIFCTDADWSTLLPSEAEIIYQSTRHADSATALGSSTAQ